MGPTETFQKMLEELLINHYSAYIQKSCSLQYVLLPTMCKEPWAISVAGREVTVGTQRTIWSSGERLSVFERTDFWALLLQKERSQSWMKSGRGARLERAVNMKSLSPECSLQEAPGLGSQLLNSSSGCQKAVSWHSWLKHCKSSGTFLLNRACSL